MEQEVVNLLTLAAALHFSPEAAVQLYRKAGSATAVIDNRRNIGDMLHGLRRNVAAALADVDGARRKAEAEIEYAARTGVRILPLGADGYPQRLADCADAPLALFFRGTADLNGRRVVSMVGTRRCTAYGQDCARSFVRRLSELCPDALVVSGLAYGIDICAHREALASGLDTVAVLAHGLDNLYPPRHRDTADEMTRHGGLMTEYFTHTNADKLNFLRRNRIVAGVADATVVVESAHHGGALVTARLAQGYGRDVFAFPGRMGDEYSEGCNNLIRDNKAALVTSAYDLVRAMGWADDARMAEARRKGIERTLFPELTEDEQAVADMLGKDNDLQINTLAARTAIPVGALSAVMFSLEMKGVVKLTAGGVYHLIKN